MKLTLSKPITAHGEELTELELREPTGDEVCEIGFPYLLHINDGETMIELRPKLIRAYVSKLAGVPPSSLSALSPADISTATGVVMGFFGMDQAGKQMTAQS